MQFVIFRLFGYIPAPILFGNLIDSTCLLWKSTCGEKGGRCLLYDIEQFRYRYINYSLIYFLRIIFIFIQILNNGFRYVGLCAGIKILALALFLIDWWLVRRRRQMEDQPPSFTVNEFVGSIISLDKREYNGQLFKMIYVEIIMCIVMYVTVFEEKPHHQNVGDGDATLPSSEIPTPSSISSPTEPTKSTNLEETGSSNQTQDLAETTNRSKNTEVEVPDTRQAPLAIQEPDVEIKPSSGLTENRNRDV